MARLRNRDRAAVAPLRRRHFFGLERLESRCVLSVGSYGMMPPQGSPEVHSGPAHQSGAMDLDGDHQGSGAMESWSQPGRGDGQPNSGLRSRMAPPENYGFAGGSQIPASSPGFEIISLGAPSNVIIIVVFSGNSAPAARSTPPNVQNSQLAGQKTPPFADPKSIAGAFILPDANPAARFAEPAVVDSAGQAAVQTPPAPAQTAPAVVAAGNALLTVPTTTAFATGAAAAGVRTDIATVAEFPVHSSAHEAQVTSLVPRAPAAEAGGGQAINSASVANLFAEMSSPALAIHLLQSKAVLATVPLNLKGIERALEHVMVDLQRLGNHFTEWLDENRAAAIALAITTTVTAAGAAGLYLRRRTLREIEERNDETSSNWLFVRMQTPSGE